MLFFLPGSFLCVSLSRVLYVCASTCYNHRSVVQEEEEEELSGWLGDGQAVSGRNRTRIK